MLINYKDINNSNDWLDLLDLGVILSKKEVSASPSSDTQDAQSLGRNKVFLETIYTHRDIGVDLLVKGDSLDSVNSKINELLGIFTQKLSIIFKDNPNLLYRDVRMTQEVKVDKVNSLSSILTFSFTAYDPFRYAVEETVVERELLSISNITVENKGNYKAKPVITISGASPLVKITLDGKTLEYRNLAAGDEIVIDNDRYTVVNKKSGETLNALRNWAGSFLELKPGENDIEVNASGSNVNIKITVRDTYL